MIERMREFSKKFNYLNKTTQLYSASQCRTKGGAKGGNEPNQMVKSRTCPSDASATGCGDISEKIMSSGFPSSFSIMLKASSVENGAMRAVLK
jgi:hypothetical protein